MSVEPQNLHLLIVSYFSIKDCILNFVLTVFLTNYIFLLLKL